MRRHHHEDRTPPPQGRGRHPHESHEDPHGGRGGRGRHGRGRGEGGPEGERHERMERGALRPVLLDTLRDGPKHGYDMIRSIEERTQGQYAPSPGTVYPTLQYLEDLGQIRVQSEGERRVYAITEAGLAELDAQADRVAAFWSRFTASPDSEPLRHERRFLEEELDNLGRTVWRGLSGAFDRGDRDLIRRVRKAITDCQEQIRGLIADGAGDGP